MTEATRPPERIARPVIRTVISTRERRYLFNDLSKLDMFVRSRTSPLEYVPGRQETRITTVYLDTPEGTWSVGKTRTKFRCKTYQDPNLFWFEVKQRKGLKVDKWRQPITPSELPEVLNGTRRGTILRRLIGDTPLRPIVSVRYRRTAFEVDDLRLTFDRDVTFFKVRPADPWEIGAALGRRAGYVVEVKRNEGVPDWLKDPFKGNPRRKFSKSKWALLARKMEWNSR